MYMLVYVVIYIQYIPTNVFLYNIQTAEILGGFIIIYDLLYTNDKI